MATQTTDTKSDGAERPAATQSDAATNLELDLLIVGTFGGGGINQYIDEQRRRLGSHVSTARHEMGMAPEGSGPTWFLWGVLLGLAAMARFPWRRPPDVVHVHTSHRFSFYRSAFYVLYARYVWGVPVVLHVHGSSFDEFVAEASPPVALLQSVVFGAVSDVIVLSEYWRQVVADRADESKIEVLPNAVDVDDFQASRRGDEPRIVFVSNLRERKGVADLVDAVDALLSRTNRPVTVDIAGDGPLADRVETLARRHDAVTAHGYVSEGHKRELLAAGSIYVLPTYAEGLPIALLEGMAAGNAVVSTPVGAIPEVVDEENGHLVPAGDPDTLADALADLVDAPDRCREIGEINRELVADRYDWDHVIAELESLYAARADGRTEARP